MKVLYEDFNHMFEVDNFIEQFEEISIINIETLRWYDKDYGDTKKVRVWYYE